ncbi:MAG: phage tail protein [Calditrichaeota bacterium]|nr:phage tail protein [Calditrichota bacterium]
MSVFDLLTKDDDELNGKLKGVAVAIVTNNKDPKKMGRVKVRFPWRENKDESYWARVATLMAGKDRGCVFLPERDDEVLVAFEKEDITHPYIIGALWNGPDNPPEKNEDGKNNIRKIRSRSGHELVFNDDSAGKKEKVEIHTNAGHKIILDDSAGSEKIEITDRTESNSIKIDSVSNSITIECTAKLTIRAKQIDIQADAMMNIKAGATLTIQGTLVKIN